jgi:hypothetical protein
MVQAIRSSHDGTEIGDEKLRIDELEDERLGCLEGSVLVFDGSSDVV